MFCIEIRRFKASINSSSFVCICISRIFVFGSCVVVDPREHAAVRSPSVGGAGTAVDDAVAPEERCEDFHSNL